MIYNANTMSLENANTNLPNMSTTLESWFQTLIVGILIKTSVNNRVVETTTNYSASGVIHPFKVQQLEIKPEGQRAWKWFVLRCKPDLIMAIDDTAVIHGARHRVMGIIDYTEYGYLEYELVRDYDTIMEETPEP